MIATSVYAWPHSVETWRSSSACGEFSWWICVALGIRATDVIEDQVASCASGERCMLGIAIAGSKPFGRLKRPASLSPISVYAKDFQCCPFPA
jgi:hypothetical protein